MATFLYAPAVKARVATKDGVIDVSHHIVSGNVQRNIGSQPSKATLSLANPRRIYDGRFTPNDRIVIHMKRVKWVQVFAGYLDQVPYFSVYSKEVKLTASCTLKRILYHHWDPGLSVSQALLNMEATNTLPGHSSEQFGNSPEDRGAKGRAEALLTKVLGWNDARIHIGEVPTGWYERIRELHGVVQESLANRPEWSTGQQSSIRGQLLTGDLPTEVEVPSNLADNPAVGKLPYSKGTVSWFGGPKGGAYGNMELTGESGVNPTDPWFCAMRFPYNIYDNATKSVRRNPTITAAQKSAARDWWRDRKLVVINPKNGKAAVVRCADWGPASWAKDIDLSEHCLHGILQATTEDEVEIRFAPEGAQLGPHEVEAASKVALGGQAALPDPVPKGTSPSGNDWQWGGYSNGEIPLSVLEKFTEQGTSEPAGQYLHPIAARAWAQMKEAASKAGLTLDGTGYRSLNRQRQLAGPRAATPGTSRHGWALAVDVSSLFGSAGAATTSKYDKPLYKWLWANGHKFGWVNPAWAQKGGSLPEPWHWEFYGIFNVAQGRQRGSTSGGFVEGASATSANEATVSVRPGDFAGIPAGDGDSLSVDLGGVSGAPGATEGEGGLLNVYEWMSRAGNAFSETLAGPKALMNDQPAMPMLNTLMSASLREFSSGPNGDFIAWFPDYFGVYGTAGVMNIRPIEMQDFNVVWDDTRLKTHWFTMPAIHGWAEGPAPGGPVPTEMHYMTEGVVSVDFPEVLGALMNVPKDSVWGNAGAILKRFGARPHTESVPFITGNEAAFYIAVRNFMRNWASMFSASVDLTFMPELWPGMLARFESHGFQGYINSVTHSFNHTGGFSTSLSLIAPSSIEGEGLVGFARGEGLGSPELPGSEYQQMVDS